jgi:mannose-1-phosphate guanylyltransferase
VPVEVSLHLVRVPDARAFGCVPTDGSGRVTGFVEKSDNPVTDQVNAGCYVFRRRVVDAIPADRVVSVERETFPALVEDGALVVGYLETAYWRDVGSPQALVAASADVVTGRAPSQAIGPAEGEARVSPGATVEGEVSGGSLVLPGAVVRRGARVSGSVLMAGATVEEDAVVTDSVVGPGARVGRGARLVEVTVGDHGVVCPGACPPPGTRVDCDAAWA